MSFLAAGSCSSRQSMSIGRARLRKCDVSPDSGTGKHRIDTVAYSVGIFGWFDPGLMSPKAESQTSRDPLVVGASERCSY